MFILFFIFICLFYAIQLIPLLLLLLYYAPDTNKKKTTELLF